MNASCPEGVMVTVEQFVGRIFVFLFEAKEVKVAKSKSVNSTRRMTTLFPVHEKSFNLKKIRAPFSILFSYIFFSRFTSPQQQYTSYFSSQLHFFLTLLTSVTQAATNNNKMLHVPYVAGGSVRTSIRPFELATINSKRYIEEGTDGAHTVQKEY